MTVPPSLTVINKRLFYQLFFKLIKQPFRKIKQSLSVTYRKTKVNQVFIAITQY